MKLLLAFFSSICINAIATAQPTYIFQKDDSLLKKKYYEQALAKKHDVLLALGKEHLADYQRIYDEQFSMVAGLFQTSRSVTAPEAHAYLQAVLQSIVNVNPTLKQLDLRVVFSRDWWPNAYSVGDGTIVINAGLMIYLRNEAELAFVIAHELSHYYLNHSHKQIDNYVQTVNSAGFQEDLKRLSKQQYRVNQELDKLAKSIVFDSRFHSRANESEADRQGFIFLKPTGYDCNAVRTTLELLDNIDDSSLFKPLDVRQAFNFADYPFKPKWIQQESSLFSKLDETAISSPMEKDSLKTHPDCPKRIQLLHDSLANVAIPGKPFLVNASLFNQLKKDFFLEITEECYKEGRLSRNLYYSLLLLQSNTATRLAIYSIARCLNQLYANQKDHVLGTTIDTEDKRYSADYNQLLRLLSRLRLEELASINDYFCKQHLDEMKDDPSFTKEVEKIRTQSN